MKNKTGFEIFVLDTLPRWLMYVVGVMLLVLIGLQMGMYKGREAQREKMSNELKAISNELREAEIKLKEMEKEIEHQRLIKSIAMCESSLRHDVYGDNGKSFGIAQFQKATFYWLTEKLGMKGLKWKNRDDQITLLSLAVRLGYGHNWSCYKKIMREKK